MPCGKRGGRTVVGGRANAKYEVRSTKWKFGATPLRKALEAKREGWRVVGQCGRVWREGEWEVE